MIIENVQRTHQLNCIGGIITKIQDPDYIGGMTIGNALRTHQLNFIGGTNSKITVQDCIGGMSIKNVWKSLLLYIGGMDTNKCQKLIGGSIIEKFKMMYLLKYSSQRMLLQVSYGGKT